jgi:selenobiotic family peptide radical SAM maturase
MKKLDQIFQATRKVAPEGLQHLFDENAKNPEEILTALQEQVQGERMPSYVAELARLEFTLYQCASSSPPPANVQSFQINPTLSLLEFGYSGFLRMLDPLQVESKQEPQPGSELILLWKKPEERTVQTKVASPRDLLALKIVAENIAPEKIAQEHGLLPLELKNVLSKAAGEGLLLAPKSKIVRSSNFSSKEQDWAWPRYARAKIFTLQWHVTQACDLHCRHCYDRTQRSDMPFEQALTVLDKFKSFCDSRHVQGQISFTGGNPLLYPKFSSLYARASERGFILAILGNPAKKDILRELQDIQSLAFYQVSLEGLQEHNDWIRGTGHFKKVLNFLDTLRELGISSQVMLTLTKENIDQILPLARVLQGRTDRFTFNRLSSVGEGADLQLPGKRKYASFMQDYLQAAKELPFLGLKDNLLNARLWENGAPVFGGCTGFGCGAAFNFVSLLPDGEVHACRKFESKIGNLYDQDLVTIYKGQQARLYRSGPSECQGCTIRPVCRGCLAVISSSGLDVHKNCDPYCFF